MKIEKEDSDASSDIKLPSKTLLERPCNVEIRDAYLGAHFPKHLADLLSRRLDSFVDPDILLSPRLSEIRDPSSIPSIDRAIDRIEDAIVEGHRIALVCDHDMDGTGSAAVLWTALVNHFGVPSDRVTVITSHRLKEGYGLTEPVVSRIRKFGAQLVITADNGSSDEPRIAMLANNGIDVIVTDHHVIPADGPPPSALAVINPSRKDAHYDRHICGAGVAFLLMAKVRSRLIDTGYQANTASLVELLDYVAVATIADCVSLSPSSSTINRTFIRRGIQQIRMLSRPCWRAIMRDRRVDIDPETIAFRVAPAIAASGRLDWAELGFRFLVSGTDDEADACWLELKKENSERQTVERRIRKQAFTQAAKDPSPSIVLFMEDGHAGVHGIAASRVVETFGKPCAIFCPKGRGVRDGDDNSAGFGTIATGSFRSIPGVNVHSALQDIATAHPDLLLSYGGHQSAAGATVRICDFEKFRIAFCDAVTNQGHGLPFGRPILWTDGELDAEFHTPSAVQELEKLGPFGRGFEDPIFSGRFCVIDFRSLSEGRHYRFSLKREGLSLPAIWFSIDSALDRLPKHGDTIKIAYQLRLNRFRGLDTVEATVVAGEILDSSPAQTSGPM